jgi:large repetitive protein
MVYSLSVSGVIDRLVVLNSSPYWGQVNSSYVFSLGSLGGFSSVSWTIVAGSLPPGLTLAANGAITGTPTTAGTYSFTARATDSGNPPQTDSANLSILINP